MKKLSLNKLNLQEGELLQRKELKTILGGYQVYVCWDSSAIFLYEQPDVCDEAFLAAYCENRGGGKECIIGSPNP